ncbi:DUF3231 family protein [Robertmurraya sp. GLU-23]
MNQNTDRLTSPEIANLWTHYIRETMGICVIKYMHKNIKDSTIKKVFQTAHRLGCLCTQLSLTALLLLFPFGRT